MTFLSTSDKLLNNLKSEFQRVLSAAAGVGYLRINRLRELTCGDEICYVRQNFFIKIEIKSKLQFYLLDKPAHKTADKELGLDEAFNYLQYQIQVNSSGRKEGSVRLSGESGDVVAGRGSRQDSSVSPRVQISKMQVYFSFLNEI